MPKNLGEVARASVTCEFLGPLPGNYGLTFGTRPEFRLKRVEKPHPRPDLRIEISSWPQDGLPPTTLIRSLLHQLLADRQQFLPTCFTGFWIAHFQRLERIQNDP